MKQISIATFISNSEKFNNDFYNLYKQISKKYQTECYIFCDKKIDNIDNSINQIVTPKMTKYKRIEKLIDISKYENIICIDNDIKPDVQNIIKFINNVVNRDYAIAWGKIKAKNVKGFI